MNQQRKEYHESICNYTDLMHFLYIWNPMLLHCQDITTISYGGNETILDECRTVWRTKGDAFQVREYGQNQSQEMGASNWFGSYITYPKRTHTWCHIWLLPINVIINSFSMYIYIYIYIRVCIYIYICVYK